MRIVSPVFSRNARPPSAERNAFFRPMRPIRMSMVRFPAVTMGRVCMVWAQTGVRMMFSADGSTMGPPADME